MTGVVLSCGTPFSPWQAAQSCAFSSMVWAPAGRVSVALTTTRAATTCPSCISALTTVRRRDRSGPVFTTLMAVRSCPSIQREGDDGVAALVVELHIAAGRDHDVLLASDHVRGRRRVDAGTGIERPQHIAVAGVVGAEAAIAFAGEHQPAGGREDAADHRLRRLHLPADLSGIVVNGGDVAPLFLGRDDLEGAAEPQLAGRVGRTLHLIGHGLVQVDGITQPELRI